MPGASEHDQFMSHTWRLAASTRVLLEAPPPRTTKPWQVPGYRRTWMSGAGLSPVACRTSTVRWTTSSSASGRNGSCAAHCADDSLRESGF